MFTDLPEHLQTLNSISNSPPSGMTAENEDAFWEFMHTDELFRNFGSIPSPPQPTPPVSKDESVPTPITASTSKPDVQQLPQQQQPVDLASFVAAFASETTYTLPLTLPAPFAESSSSASQSVNTADVMPQFSSSSSPWDTPAPGTPGGEAERISGAKKLKSIGAGVAEIEEDKRRRNTEASARFRAKKKEREQALEQRAKELEAQVAQLVAEKQSLASENSLLKTIVLGASNSGQGVEALAAMLGKRKREA